MITVLDHFRATLPGHDQLIADEDMTTNMSSMPLDSTCGDDCKAAIDAAGMLRTSIVRAFGPGSDLENDVVNAALQTVGCFICG